MESYKQFDPEVQDDSLPLLEDTVGNLCSMAEVISLRGTAAIWLLKR